MLDFVCFIMVLLIVQVFWFVFFTWYLVFHLSWCNTMWMSPILMHVSLNHPVCFDVCRGQEAWWYANGKILLIGTYAHCVIIWHVSLLHQASLVTWILGQSKEIQNPILPVMWKRFILSKMAVRMPHPVLQKCRKALRSDNIGREQGLQLIIRIARKKVVTNKHWGWRIFLFLLVHLVIFQNINYLH